MFWACPQSALLKGSIMAVRSLNAPQPEPYAIVTSRMESRIVIGGFALAGLMGIGLAVAAVLTPAGLGNAALPGITAADGGADRGLLVTSVQSGSAASGGGIAVGDRIISINGSGIGSLAAARAFLRNDRANVIDIRVAHNHSVHHVILIRSGEKPDEPQDSRRRR
jgi:membrane-associated protease RseP (regulator of RpoE activity)